MKFPLTLLLLFFGVFSFSQNIILREGFESGNIPVEWVFVDNDGDGEMWEMHPDNWTSSHSGLYKVASSSYPFSLIID